MLIVAIIMIPASWALKIVYGQQLREWEYNLIESWGINSIVYDFAKIGLLIGATVYYVIRQKRKREKDNSRFYELPKS